MFNLLETNNPTSRTVLGAFPTARDALTHVRATYGSASTLYDVDHPKCVDVITDAGRIFSIEPS